MLFMSGLPYAVAAPQVDLVLNTAAVLLAAVAASRAWIRYEEATEDDGLFQASAFLVLLVGGVLRLAIIATGTAAEFGYDVAAPGQAPLIVTNVTSGIAAVLMLIAAFAALRRWRRPRPWATRVWLFAPALAALGTSLVVLRSGPRLPSFIAPERLARMIEPGVALDPSALSPTWALMQLAIGAIFAVGAAYFAVVARRSRRPGYPAYLAAGLIAATFMQVHFAAAPGGYAGIVTGGDLLRLLFYLLVLAGVGVATRADLVALAAANRDLERLRDMEKLGVLADERARMARDVHDGLVQDIWLARLTGGQLAKLPDLPAEARQVVSRVDSILEGALAEAREVVLALQPDSSGDFGELLGKFVADYGERFDMEIDLKIDGSAPPLAPDVQRELIRISREALNNTRKHADAGRVWVTLESTGSSLRLTLGDNGQGFLPADKSSSAYGLRSMRERADKIGATLDIVSAPLDGTQVVVDLETGPRQPSWAKARK